MKRALTSILVLAVVGCGTEGSALAHVCRTAGGQGWAYALIWCMVLVAPFTLLVSRHLPLESLVWLAIAMAGTILLSSPMA